MKENQIATAVVDAAFKIHTALGPGLLESVYEATLEYELKKRGLVFIDRSGCPSIMKD